MKFDPKYFTLKTPATKGFVRIGGPHDGGYVLVDDLDDMENVVSVGVGSDVAFELELAETRLAVVSLIDGTVPNPPVDHDHFDFIHRNWDEDRVKVREIYSDSGIYSLDSYAILKFDCDGAEWDCLPKLNPMDLVRFTQIVCELHDLDTRFDPDAFAKLTTFHELVHVHPNNFGGTFDHDGKTWPKVVECTFLRRDRDKFKPHTKPLPLDIDSPNCPSAPDIRWHKI